MLDRLTVYDIIFALAADEGRETALFGTCGPLAKEAFARSLTGEGFPVVWFELPLLSTPRFDLHVALSRRMLRAGVPDLPVTNSGYDRLFRWYENTETGGNGLAFAYDVSEGRIDDPAVHVNVNDSPLDDIDRFFDLAGGVGAAALYHGFTDRLPPGWHVWYAGVHPGRPGSPVRVDCFVESALTAEYAADIASLERDLRACGFTALSPALRDLVTPILRSPFGLELQFDVMRDGTVGPTLGISAAFSLGSAGRARSLFGQGGTAAGLMEAIERLGLTDKRWHHVADAAFSEIVNYGDETLVMYCSPTFVKLRLRDGIPLDAKMYMQASARSLMTHIATERNERENQTPGS